VRVMPSLRYCDWELWPDDSEEVRENQRNFAKLWHSTRSNAARHWKVNAGRRCELYLVPKEPCLVSRVYISPLAQGGSLLRFRAVTDQAQLSEVRDRIRGVSAVLPVPTEPVVGQLSERLWFLDLLVPLHSLLGIGAAPTKHEARLFGQVVPVLDALTANA